MDSSLNSVKGLVVGTAAAAIASNLLLYCMKPSANQIIKQEIIHRNVAPVYDSSEDEANLIIRHRDQLEALRQEQQLQLEAFIRRRAAKALDKERIAQEKARVQALTQERVAQQKAAIRAKQFAEDESILQEIHQRRQNPNNV